MEYNPIVLDIETQNSFQEVGHDVRKLKVSVVGIYEYATDKYSAFKEKELPNLFPMLEKASFLIGFNINRFDLPVLAPYYLGKISQFQTLDLLDIVEKSLGYRVALDDLARGTLGTKKTGHGFMAIEYFRSGQWDKLISYCLEDVRITRELYEYGLKEKKLYFNDVRGKKEISVNFENGESEHSPVSLSLPF